MFEKSKGLGGRMATRRTTDHQFDHGAQYFRADGKGFLAQVAEWSRTGVAAPWSGDRYVGTPGMTAPARDLASGKTVVHGISVSRIARGPSGGWTVMTLPVSSTLPATVVLMLSSSRFQHPRLYLSRSRAA